MNLSLLFGEIMVDRPFGVLIQVNFLGPKYEKKPTTGLIWLNARAARKRTVA
jgi:hypothetical protein